jgi:hypothetical protein
MPPPNDPTPGEVYHELLDKLRQAGAISLAQDIERTVARGVVLAEQETQLYQSSSVYRPMEEKEALAVALEFFVTALEVPLMLNAARHTVGGDSIEWRSERPGSERENVDLGPIGEVDQQALRLLLLKILEIAHELGISLPEVA